MAASIDTRKAHLTRPRGDLTVIYTWVNDQRAMVLVPHRRAGAPWFIVMESSSFSWDDSDPRNVSTVVHKANKAYEVLGIEATPHNFRRLAGIIIDGLPDLIRMPSAPPTEYHRASYGNLMLKADGVPMASEEIRVEKEGVTYG